MATRGSGVSFLYNADVMTFLKNLIKFKISFLAKYFNIKYVNVSLFPWVSACFHDQLTGCYATSHFISISFHMRFALIYNLIIISENQWCWIAPTDHNTVVVRIFCANFFWLVTCISPSMLHGHYSGWIVWSVFKENGSVGVLPEPENEDPSLGPSMLCCLKRPFKRSRYLVTCHVSMFIE